MNKYIITGVSRGLGKALAEELLKSTDNQVIGLGRSCAIEHPNFEWIKVDLSQAQFEIPNSIFECNPSHASLTLINNAGVIEPIGLLGTLDFEKVAKLYQVNITAAHRLMDVFVAATSSFHRKKVVLNISSGAARYPVKAWSAYCASKAALDMLSLCLAKEHPDIQVLSLAPGVIDTFMQNTIRSQTENDFPEMERFQKYFEEGALHAPDFVAKKIIALLRSEKKKEVVLNLRDY